MVPESVDAQRMRDERDFALMHCVKVDAVDGGFAIRFWKFVNTYHVPSRDSQLLCRIVV